MISTIGDETCRAFIPNSLPPTPKLDITARLQDTIDRSLLALGGLNNLSTLIPDPSLFLYMYVRKEAYLSSQIEGTQSSFTDLLLHESKQIPGVPTDDLVEVSNYVAAVYHGIDRIKNGFPLSLRLIREMHQILLNTGRGSKREPGEFRKSQNWIGGDRPGNAIFVPPPADKVMECLGDLEKFLHNDPVKTPVLIKAALAHVQFETIHPFLDGNGRLGRLLVTLILCSENALSDPILYLSLYFKNRRQEYYDLLQRVRTEGEWEDWLLFFMNGVKETSEQALQTAAALVQLFNEDRESIQSYGKQAGSILRVHHIMQRIPIAYIAEIAEQTKLSKPTVLRALEKLGNLGIVEEITGRRRDRMFVYKKYFDILKEGTQPI